MAAQPPQLPAELANLDQLKVLLDALPDYHADVEQPSYVLAIPCRPIVIGLSTHEACRTWLAEVNWGALMTHCASDANLTQVVEWPGAPGPSQAMPQVMPQAMPQAMPQG